MDIAAVSLAAVTPAAAASAPAAPEAGSFATVLAAATTPAGEQLLALRALANRPLRRLTVVNPDPVGAWRREDPVTIHGLAALELRAAGIRIR